MPASVTFEQEPNEMGSARFTLQNGDTIHVMMIPDGRMGEGPYRLKIFSERGQLTVTGSAHNAVEVSTIKALIEEEGAVAAIAGRRNSRVCR